MSDEADRRRTYRELEKRDYQHLANIMVNVNLQNTHQNLKLNNLIYLKRKLVDISDKSLFRYYATREEKNN